VADDVFLGSTPGVNHWGMGGEFVVNKQSTKKYRGLLERINKDHADGGGMDPTGALPNWEPVADTLAGMTGLAFLVGTAQGGPYYGAGYALGSLLAVIGESFVAKGIGEVMSNNLHAHGGMINKFYYDGEGIQDYRPDSQYAAGQTGWGTTITTPGSGLFSGWNPGDFNPLNPGGIFDGTPVTEIIDIIENPAQAWEDLKDYAEDQWDNIRGCFDAFVDWDELRDFLVDMIRAPLKSVTKDLVDPDQFYPTGNGVLKDLLNDVPSLIWEFIKDQVGDVSDLIGCTMGYETGTNYVPQDGLYRLHQGEAVVPASENSGGGPTLVLKNCVVTTNDIQNWFANMMDETQARRLGHRYQTERIDQIGLKL